MDFSKHIRILNLDIDVLFPVVHGSNGEDGRIQSLCESIDMPYWGCGDRASVIGIDKDLQKRLAVQAQVPVGDYVALTEEQWSQPNALKTVIDTIGFPCFVKPNSLGSSIGIGKAAQEHELKKAIENAFRFDHKVLIEKLIQGKEVECAFLGTPLNATLSDLGEIEPLEFYSYEEKYVNNKAQVYIPARVEDSVVQRIHNYCHKLAQAFDLYGFCRIDFWYCTDLDLILFNEINTIPGLTSISFFPKLLERKGIRAQAWISTLIDLAFTRAKSSANKQNFPK